MRRIWRSGLYGRLGIAVFLLVAAVALLLTSSWVALNRVRSDLSLASSLANGRIFHEMLYTASRLQAPASPVSFERAHQLRHLMGRYEQVLDELDTSTMQLEQSGPGTTEILNSARIRALWQAEIKPALESAIAAAPLDETALDGLEQKIRDYAAHFEGYVGSIEQTAAVRLQRSELLQLGLAAVTIVTLFLMLRVVRQFIARVRALAAVAKLISAGDLTRRAPVEGEDELSALNASFNATTDKLAGMIEKERNAKERLERLLGTIAETAQHLSSSAAEILAGTTLQAEGMREQSVAVAETVKSVDDVRGTAVQAAERAQQVSAAYDSAVRISTEGRRALDETVDAMNTVSRRTESIANDILSLVESSLEIGEIVSVVSEIADQTNLLALNAAIEASRAGEHGRGFNAVATEIRSLADQSKVATARVRRILMENQKSTNAAVIGTEEGSKSVGRALETVTQAGETIRQLETIIAESARSVAQIAASAGQQKAGMKQIQDAMHDIEQASSQNLSAIRQSEEAAKDLNRLGSRLQRLLTEHGGEA